MNHVISKKFVAKLSRSPYVANESLLLISKIEKISNDDFLESIKFTLNKNLIIETYDRNL